MSSAKISFRISYMKIVLKISFYIKAILVKENDGFFNTFSFFFLGNIYLKPKKMAYQRSQFQT